MARKRKNSTALFEVISAGRMDRKPVAAALKTPRWWFKGQSGPAADTSSPVTIQTDPADPTANVTAAMLYRARQWMTPAPAPAQTAPAPVAAEPEPEAVRAPEPASALDDAYATADLQDVGLADTAPPGAATAVALRPPGVAMTSPTTTALAPVAAPARAIVPPSAAVPQAAAAQPGSPRALGRSKFRFDEDSQEVTLKMRYTTAIVTAFTVLVVVGTAYVIGRHLAEGPNPATASERQQSTAQVRKGPSQPGVMDLSHGSGNGPLARLETNNKPRPETPPRTSNGAAPPAANPVPAPTSAVYADAHIAPDGTAQRISNLNYVMIINLPSQYRQRAYEVRDLMTANGVPCTVEKVSKERGAPRIPANDGWYAVVGVRGFSPKFGQLSEYRAYRNAIAAAAARFPSKAKFDKVDPMDFRWVE
jgi:hypothetical protein